MKPTQITAKNRIISLFIAATMLMFAMNSVFGQTNKPTKSGDLGTGQGADSTQNKLPQADSGAPPAKERRPNQNVRQGSSRPAYVNVCGRVRTNTGQGIAKAKLTITGGFLAAPIYVSSNPFGYFCFREMDVGQTYTVFASSKRHTFDEDIKFVVLLDEINDMEFVAVP